MENAYKKVKGKGYIGFKREMDPDPHSRKRDRHSWVEYGDSSPYALTIDVDTMSTPKSKEMEDLGFSQVDFDTLEVFGKNQQSEYRQLNPEENEVIVSEFQPFHLSVQILSGVQLFLWVIGTELLCLYGNHCSIESSNALGDPRTVPTGGIALLVTAPIIVLLVLPTELVLISTEKQLLAKASSFIAMIAAIILLAISISFFVGDGNSEKWKNSEFVKQNYEGGIDMAIKVANTSTNEFGIFFILCALSMGLLSGTTYVCSGYFPKHVNRYSNLSLIDFDVSS